MTLQLLPTEDKNLLCMYDNCEDKSNEIFILEYIILVSVNQVCLCYITKIMYILFKSFN